MKPIDNFVTKSFTMSFVIFSTTLLFFAASAAAQGQQQRFFLPSTNNANFGIPRSQFQEDVDDTEFIVSQRRPSSTNSLPNSNPSPSSSSFFSSQQQGTFTNSGPFSRPPSAQQLILNAQQSQFQPVRNPGSLSFADGASTIPQPSFFQQAPIQQHQQFNFFPSNSQQQRFRPIVQQQRAEQEQDSLENFNEPQNSQQSSQERFVSDSPRRPLSQNSGIAPSVRTPQLDRNPSPPGSTRWWNSPTTDTDSVDGNDNDDQSAVSVKDDTVDQQRLNESRKRGRGQQGKRRPVTTPEPSSTSDEQEEPAAIGFTVIHDKNENRGSWSQPIITTHRPQLGQTSFRNRNSPAVISGPTVNRWPTTNNPLSVSSSSPIKPHPLQPLPSSITANKIQPTTIRSRKPSILFSTTTTTASILDDEQEEDEPIDDKRQLLPRKSTTTVQPTQIPITTLRSNIRPRLNSPAASIPQQQRMKKIINNPAIVQSITTRKPTLTTTTTTLAPTTTTNRQTAEEYDDYEDVEYTTTVYTTTAPTIKKQTKLPAVTQSSTVKINQKNNNSSIPTTESWVVVASVQTSRSVSSSSITGNGTSKNITGQEVTTSIPPITTNKNRFSSKPIITTTSTTTVESIIDKLDRVQSELSNGILYGSSSNSNNNSRIFADIQSVSNNEDKRNDVITTSSTTTTTEKMLETTVTTITPTTKSTTTTMATSTTTEKEEDEDDDKEDEEEDSDDSDQKTTFVRKFVPSKQRTSTVATITTTSTIKPSSQPGKKKTLIESVKFDELLTSGLLPPGFTPRAPPAYKSKTITTTTTTTETPPPASTSTSTSVTNTSSTVSTTINTTPISTTTKTVKAKPGLNIKFADDSSALASLLPPGFNLEDAIKPVEVVPHSLLPPGFKLEEENVDTKNKSKEDEPSTSTVLSTTDVTLSSTTEAVASSTSGIVFPNSGKVANNSGTRKPLPSSKKIQASVTVAPVIQKGWPIRASTEFTGWFTPSTTPISIEKLLSQSKASDLAAVITSTPEPTITTTMSTTSTTTTMKPPPTTTPGQCSENDSVCELVGTVRLVGSGSEKWVPELLDHNTAEWRLLANEVESQLDKVYSKSPALSKWYKKITIDSFSPGNNEITSSGKPDKNAGVLVDFFVQLNQLGRTVSTADIRRLFHETLQKEGNLESSAQPLQYGNGGGDGLYLKLGRFTVDPARTDFIVLPKTTRGVTATAGAGEAWLPQWAVAVIVIGLASLLFVLVFGLTVLISRKKNSKKVPPPTLQPSTISDEHHQSIYGTGKNGPTAGSRHMMHNAPSHSNYNISSYGYDNYAIDDDMMMLDEDDLEEVDRLYDMDAVWADHDHEKLKIPTNTLPKKHRDTQHGGHYDSWRSTALAPQALTPVQTGYYTGGGGYGYGTDPSGYGGERRHYHREPTSATNPRSHHPHYPSTHYNPNMTSYPTSPRKPPKQYHPDYDTDF